MVSPATFAKVTGVSRQAVYKAIKDGRLDDALVDNGGKKKAMDLDKASKIWTATMAPRQLDPVRVAEVIRTPEEEVPDFYTSRARKEHYNAELARISTEQQLQDLVPAAQVQKESFAMARAVRESLANLADRLSNERAGESDPSRIHQMLVQEHRQCLIELCDA
jgi:predicted site-specific integrase-resolvase